MCIVAFAWQTNPNYPLILLLNRDEYHDRPTKAAGWWWEGGEIVGGKDEVGGGTWLACSTNGRVAFLTNLLELRPSAQAKTRGDLPLRFLQSKKRAKEFGEELAKEGDLYNGFNLMMVELNLMDGKNKSCMYYVTNRPKSSTKGKVALGFSIEEVPPGFHVLSNSNFHSPWPKAQQLKVDFKKLVKKHIEEGRGELPIEELVGTLMKNTIKVNDETKLPHICSPNWEFSLSSIFVDVDTPLGCYGTRSTSGLTIRGNGEASLYETYLDEDETWKEHTIDFRMQVNNKINCLSWLLRRCISYIIDHFVSKSHL